MLQTEPEQLPVADRDQEPRAAEAGGGADVRLEVVQLMTLMTTGLYNEPAGAYLPSIMY